MATEPIADTTPTLRRDVQHGLYRRALEHMPGGTDSNFRAWGESTIYVDRGKGGLVWDADGNEYVDLRMGYGPVILGHGDERVDDYVNERMRRGVSFSLTSEDEIRAIELVCELTGWVDKARMTVSGTEATIHAMRVARAYTEREKIVKFEGQYHGVHDYALISVSPDNMDELGDEDNPVGLAWGRGIPGAVAETIIPARYNNIDFLRRDDRIGDGPRDTPAPGQADRVVLVAELVDVVGRDADEGVVVDAVILPFELDDLLALGEGARHAHGMHRGLGA